MLFLFFPTTACIPIETHNPHKTALEPIPAVSLGDFVQEAGKDKQRKCWFSLQREILTDTGSF